MAAEAKTLGERIFDRRRCGRHAEGEIRNRIVEIPAQMERLSFKAERGDGEFEGPRCTDRVSQYGFRAVEFSPTSEFSLDDSAFDRIIDLSAGAMRIDIIDLCGRNPGITQRSVDH